MPGSGSGTGEKIVIAVPTTKAAIEDTMIASFARGTSLRLRDPRR
jgi:hypothetical protein